MKSAHCVLCACLMTIATSAVFGDDPIKPIDGIGPVGPLQLVSQGHLFTEGPAADADGRLYFTDAFGGKIHRLLPDGQVETFLAKTSGANGLMFDKTGRLFACQGGKGRIIVIDVKTKEIAVAADLYADKPFNRPNDLVVDRHGGVYFTDPRFPGGNQDKSAFYYVTADGDVTRLGDDVNFPNGILLSPDEKTLYVLPYRGTELLAYPIESPGKIGAGRALCGLKPKPNGKPNGGDGLTVDVDGNLYLAVPGSKSIQVVSAAGKLLGFIPVPKSPSNCTFGGPDMKTLYITAVTNVYAAPMSIAGHRFGGGSEQ